MPASAAQAQVAVDIGAPVKVSAEQGWTAWSERPAGRSRVVGSSCA